MGKTDGRFSRTAARDTNSFENREGDKRQPDDHETDGIQ